MFTILLSIFILSGSCYLLFLISDPLEEVGGKIGKALRLPDSVVASTFQALATSGPEIVMAIIVATPFIYGFPELELGEKASSGTLNMAFSAMDNLLGIGAVAIIYMIYKKMVKKEDKIVISNTTKLGLVTYILASLALSISVWDGVLTYFEAVLLASFGVIFVLGQFLVPREKKISTEEKNDYKDLFKNLAIYSFLVFALVVFVQQCLSATFSLATLGIASVGGILLAITSYVSSFPEFMMAFRYVMKNKKDALLAMLFGSNIIDISFAGFRTLYTNEEMHVYTTGLYPELLKYYVLALPITAILLYFGFNKNKIRWGHSYYLVGFYLVYVISGFILL